MEPENVVDDVRLEDNDNDNGNSGDEDSALPQQKLALQNHVIMTNVGKYLTPTDLASARLTCKSWSRIMKFYQTIKLTKHNLQEFLRVTNTNNLQLGGEFSNYHIYDVSFNDENIYTLFHQYGKFMIQLKITLKDSSSQLNSYQFKQNIMTLTPNLVELAIEYDGNVHQVEDGANDAAAGSFRAWNQNAIFSNINEGKLIDSKIVLPAMKQIKLHVLEKEEFQSKNFLTDFFNAAVNVKSVTINNPLSDFNDREIQPNSSTLSALRNKIHGLQNLKKLELDELTEIDFKGLIELSTRKVKPLCLTNIYFLLSLKENHNFSSTLFGMEIFLQLQGNYLKTLSLYTPLTCALMDLSPGRVVINFPPLPQLQTLNLILDLSACKVQFNNGSYLANFPKLTKLSCNSNMRSGGNDALQIIGWEQLMPYSYPSPLVSHFCTNFINSSNQLYKLVELFPNLTKLELVITSYKLVQELWSWNKWPMLEGLDLRFNADYRDNSDEYLQQVQLIDEYITGIPKEFHAECVLRSCYDGKWQEYKTKPGIYDLKNLRQLKLCLRDGIHDVSAVCGFAHSNSKLFHLHVQHAKFISSECRETIKNTLGPQACILYEEEAIM